MLKKIFYTLIIFLYLIHFLFAIALLLICNITYDYNDDNESEPTCINSEEKSDGGMLNVNPKNELKLLR